MRIWSASAIDRYYLDPTIELLHTGDRQRGRPRAAGYYIVLHSGPDCCQAFRGASTGDLGPFSSRAKARNWSRRFLVESGGPAN